MKRSEIVKHLQSNTKVELSKEVSSYLLRLLELKGMLPPPVEVFDETTGQFHGRKEYKWEEE